MDLCQNTQKVVNDQFIKVNRSIEEDDRIRLSMLQRVWQQIEGAGLQHSAVIAAAQTQEELILTQLGAAVVHPRIQHVVRTPAARNYEAEFAYPARRNLQPF